MQLSRAQLSPSDIRKWLLAGEYFSCGQKGHYVNACPSRPRPSVTVGVQCFPTSTQVLGKIILNPYIHLYNVSIDSGAEYNFIE